jgi:hypothetical protein
VSEPSPSAPRPRYRPAAVAALDVTATLDRQLRTTTPARWAALAAVVAIVAAAIVWGVLGRAPVLVIGRAALLPGDGLVSVTALTDGVLVSAIDRDIVTVQAGQEILRLRDVDGSEQIVAAPATGDLVERAPLSLGDRVSGGDVVGALVPSGSDGDVVAFVDPTAATTVRPGMSVRLAVDAAPSSAYGTLRGTVTTVDAVPFGIRDFAQLTAGNDTLAHILPSHGTLRVTIELQAADTASGFAWTSTDGPPFALPPASTMTASIETGERSPLSFVAGG